MYAKMEDAMAAMHSLNGTPLYPGLPFCEVRIDKKMV